MPDEKAAKPAKTEAAVEEAPKVERERLIANAPELFGVEPYVAVGAFSHYGHGDSDLTVEVAQKAVADFLKSPVKEG